MRLIDMDKLPERKYKEVKHGWANQASVYCDGWNDAIDEIIDNEEVVDAVPVRHGRWIDIDSEMYTWKIRCNKCGYERSMMSTGQIYPRYCENCGTRMDGDSHE